MYWKGQWAFNLYPHFWIIKTIHVYCQLTHELFFRSHSFWLNRRYDEISSATMLGQCPRPDSISYLDTTAPKASRLAMRPQFVTPSLKSSVATELITLMSSPLSSKHSFASIPRSYKQVLNVSQVWKYNMFTSYTDRKNRPIIKTKTIKETCRNIKKKKCLALNVTSHCFVVYYQA